PVLVTNWTQFTQTFGDFVPGSYLAHSVYGYFMNGGGACYVMRIGTNGAAPPAQGQLTSGAASKQAPAYKVTAIAPGARANGLTVEVADSDAKDAKSDDTFKLVVKRDGKVVEEFDNLTVKKGRQNAVTVVNRQSEHVRIEEVASGADLAVPSKGAVELKGG